ncbi:MAG: protein kinase [Candidatus Eisenbacteria bacterium]|nr:protein kinase [Candidatus Eisenbacteria bacterium]
MTQTLTPGARLGPYEIIAPLGAGGMGEVYRARDTRLGRDVAVKVLPQHLSADADIRTRFEREAKTVSSLNHPHICTLHDVGREGEIDYLVMELIEGETLAERLTKGPLSTPEVLRLGGQIADALDRAHRAGVIHRDLKPGNVMLTKAGAGAFNAKLMDFGLARATDQAGRSGGGTLAGGSGGTFGATGPNDLTLAALTQTPTVAQPLTAQGTIVGTFQYMSPEQLEGKESDARADLWAFGCVLYEMITGTRPFHGTSQASLIAAILERTPAPMSSLVPLTPPPLERVVRQCLAKDRDDRWQTAADLRRELKWIEEGGSQAGTPAAIGARPRGRARMSWVVPLAALAVGAVGALIGSRILMPLAPARPVRFSVGPPGSLTNEGGPANAIISPDGRFLAMATADTSDGRTLWIRALDQLDPRQLPGTEGAFYPFWSPDSRSIGFFADGKLKRINLDGGRPQILCDAITGRGGSWGSNGDILFSPSSQSPLLRVSETGGEATPVTTLDAGKNEIAHRWPCFLPDGRRFLYLSLPIRDNQFDTFLGSLDGKPGRLVTRADGGVVLATPGFLLLNRNETLLALKFDVGRAATVGEPISLGDVPDAGGNLGEPNVSASNDGVLAWLRVAPPNNRVARLDRSGRSAAIPGMIPGPYYELSVSPDGSRGLLSRFDPESNIDMWLIDLVRGTTTRFTSDPGIEWYFPAWSPDGRRVAYGSNRNGPYDIYARPVLGSGREELLYASETLKKWPTSWSPDGGTIVFDTNDPTTGEDIWALSLAGERKAAPWLDSRFNENGGIISPDGTWIGYVSDESGRDEIYVQPFPTPGARVQVSTDGGVDLNWHPDGHELYYRTPGDVIMAARVEAAADEFRASIPRVLFQLPSDLGSVEFNGEWGFGLLPVGTQNPETITTILNWTTLLEKP